MAPDYAIYGVQPYGTALYGKAPAADFVVYQFSATLVESGVSVFWGKPTGNWSTLRLVRGAYGYPTDEIDGTILIESPAATNPTVYVDTAVNELRFYYYSLFLQVPDGSWRRAGDVMILVPKDYGSAERLYELTPQVYRDGDLYYTVQSANSDWYGRGLLETFLSVLGDATDAIRSDLESLLWVSDPMKVAGNLLEVMAKQYGLPYEAELGMAMVRRQIATAVYMYKMKGSRLGLQAAVTAFSGWDAVVSTEANLVPTSDDASFDVTLGRWAEFSNVALSRQPLQGALTTSGTGVLIMTALAAGQMEIRYPAGSTPPANASSRVSLPLLLNRVSGPLAAPASLPLLFARGSQTYPYNVYGVPLPDSPLAGAAQLPLLISSGGGAPLTFSAYVAPYGAAPVRSPFLRLIFYDANQAIVGTINGTAVAELAGPVTGNWQRYTVTGVAPSTAQYAGFGIVVPGAGAGEQHQVDAVQFEAGGVATTWEPGGGIKIVLQADRINLSDNPSFEVDASNWVVNGGTLTRQVSANSFIGAARGFLLANGTSTTLSLTTANFIPVAANTPMTFSAYWRAGFTGRPIFHRVDWYDAGGRLIQSLADGPDASLPLLMNRAAQVSDAAGIWTRTSFLVFPPAGAMQCKYTTGVARYNAVIPASEDHYVDGILIERSGQLGAYFDASVGVPISDYVWEGTAGLSHSHYYHRRATRKSRLTVRLPDFLPAGRQVRILDGQPL
jgi:phage tail-like protein